MRKTLIATSSVLALLMSPALVQAQSTPSQPAQKAQQKPDAQTAAAPAPQDMKVDMQAVYKGMRAQNLIGQNIYGANGEQIGEIEDIIANTDAMATAIVIEAGGFMGIGDTHFRVPFKDVNFTPFKDGVKIPITEAQAEKWIFDGVEQVWTGPREFRMTEVIGDYVRLKNGASFGYVDDVILATDGKLQAVVVNGSRASRYGYYAYPFYGYRHGFDPGLNHIVLPFDTADEANKAEKVDKKKFAKTAGK